MISLESSPPISITVLASGNNIPVDVACAIISFTKTPPISSVASFPPVPVIAIPFIDAEEYFSRTDDNLSLRTLNGLP